ncbi:hypothetical protein J2S09_004092 [Bacillus fengqiuensis]|nr:hypothetical protein [Bacillus fengqiuensis]
MKKVAIIGGDNKKGYEDKLKTVNFEVKYHDGRMKRKGTKNYFTNLLKDVECVILILSAVSHGTMYAVKDVADNLGIKVVYHRSKGISSVLKVVHETVAFY